MWGEPPRAYLPRVAMLNYCKGLCPPQVEVVREHFIDSSPRWQERLRNLLAPFTRVWVLMEGVPEDSPDRPVEFSLARWMYYAGSTWTGPTVRVARFDRCGSYLVAADVVRDAGDLLSYSVSAAGSSIHSGDSLGVELRWRPQLQAFAGWNVSIQLLDGAGRLVAQFDQPVTSLAFHQGGGQALVSRYALQVPEGIHPGGYELVLVIYEPGTSKHFVFADGSDSLKLATLEVQ